MWEKGAFIHHWWDYRQSSATLGVCPKDSTSYSTGTFSSSFIAARKWKQPKLLSPREWIMKMWYGMLLSSKEKLNHKLCKKNIKLKQIK